MINPETDLILINKRSAGTMVEHLGIELTAVGVDFLEGRMPVDHRTVQPMGLLHGGASVVLAETLGSIASSLLIDLSTHYPVGLEINANHLRSVSSGMVTGKATLVHGGKRTHVWDIRIVNDKNELVCISRLTVAIVEKK
ncbi:MAG: hotdog fold thioesterase [Cytophagaceae bacterium]|jgi:1,4-dihydroxy-2-naphthoyl-CoA hydrolase|nr:hotdog fold thioesterase [Cytophagaceae bacterium]